MRKGDLEVERLVRVATGAGPVGLRELEGGANSRVVQVSGASGERLVAKCYAPQAGADARDRMGAELEGLTYLWEHGLRNIPRPLAADREARVALYSFVEGRVPRGPTVSEALVRSAARMLAQLRRLSREPGARTLPEASEACFDVAATMELVSRRHRRLLAGIDRRGPVGRRAAALVETRIGPLLDAVCRNVERHAAAASLDLSAALPWSRRTLSPSDLGFKNTLLTPSGELCFLDFEYFGWDDPVKGIADFFMHPGGGVPTRHRLAFLEELAEAYSGDPELAVRLRLTYPLLAVKWCLIMLNEFLPEGLHRRRHAADRTDPMELQTRQLRRVTRRLAGLEEELARPSSPPLATGWEKTLGARPLRLKWRLPDRHAPARFPRAMP